MRLVDTSSWIEWLTDSDVGRRVGDHLPAPEMCLVPTIVQMEVAKWSSRLDDETALERILALMRTCHVVPLDTEIALAAAGACRTHRLATADAVVFATAQAHGADILTCDAHFAELPGVIFVPK
ncbi:MAG: type II toxin-antitoxin system VapC family toxin [Rhodospirillales bacterium]|jgi:predicted nucleic acid-binding protein